MNPITEASKKNQFFDMLVAFLPVCVWSWDHENGLDIHPSWFDLTGQDPNIVLTQMNNLQARSLDTSAKLDMVADWWEAGVHPDDQQRARTALNQAFFMAVPDEYMRSLYHNNYRYKKHGAVNADGEQEYLHIESMGQISWSPTGRMLSMIIVMHEVGTQAAKEAHYESQIEELKNAIAVKDTGTKKAIEKLGKDVKNKTISKGSLAAIVSVVVGASSVLSDPVADGIRWAKTVWDEPAEVEKNTTQDGDIPEVSTHSNQLAELMGKALSQTDASLVTLAHYGVDDKRNTFGRFDLQVKEKGGALILQDSWPVDLSPVIFRRYEQHELTQCHEVDGAAGSDNDLSLIQYQYSCPVRFAGKTGTRLLFVAAEFQGTKTPDRNIVAQTVKKLALDVIEVLGSPPEEKTVSEAKK